MTAEEILQPNTGVEPSVDITYYTDPLCSWSWAFEPQWRRLRFEFGSQLRWRYCMGGMIRDWNTFSDPVHSVGSPAQMGAHWYQVRLLSGVVLNELIWQEDPPSSSYPACIAFKAAELQGQDAGERYLRRLREAATQEGKNIARRTVLLDLAREMGDAPGSAFDPDHFAADFDGRAVDEFRKDLTEVRYREIGRFPSLILQPREGRGIALVGFRPYDALLQALDHVAPGIEPLRTADDLESYRLFWGSVTPEDAREALGLDLEEAREALSAS